MMAYGPLFSKGKTFASELQCTLLNQENVFLMDEKWKSSRIQIVTEHQNRSIYVTCPSRKFI